MAGPLTEFGDGAPAGKPPAKALSQSGAAVDSSSSPVGVVGGGGGGESSPQPASAAARRSEPNTHTASDHYHAQ